MKKVKVKTDKELQKLKGLIPPAMASTLSKSLELFGSSDQKISDGVLDIDTSGDPTESFLEMFKDLEAAADIMVAMILSPKDFATVDVNYTIKANGIGSNRLYEIVDKIKHILEEEYDIKGILYKALEEEYVGKGGLMKVVIPENIIDALLFKHRVDNKNLMLAMESKRYGIKETNPDPVPFSDYISISKDVDFLKINEKREEIQTTESLSLSLTHIKKRKVLSPDEVITLSTQFGERRSLTKPLLLDIDIRSVAIIHTPGAPENHVAYAVALDENGFVIDKKATSMSKDTMNKEIQKRNAGVDTNSVSYIAKKNMDDNEKKRTLQSDELFKSYMSNIILNTVKGDVVSDLKAIDVDVISHLALARALNKKKTKILIIPSTMCQYFARKYNSKGMGINKVSELTVLGSLRAMLLFSAVGNEVANQTEDVTVTADIPASVDDVDGYMKKVKRSYMKLNEHRLPIGVYDARDLSKWQHTTGVRFNFRGHPSLPNTEIAVNRETQSRPSNSDSTLLSDLRKQMLLAMGPGAEMVDSGFDINFASTAEAHRLLILKKAERDKIILLKQANALCRKILVAHGPLFKEVEDALLEDKEVKKYYEDLEDDLLKPDNLEDYVNELVIELFNSLELSLPETSAGSRIAQISEELREFIGWLEAALPAWISENMVTRDVENMDVLTEQYRSFFIREYIRSNNLLVNLDNIARTPMEGTLEIPVSDSISIYNESLMNNVHDFSNKVKVLLSKFEKSDNPPEPEPVAEPNTDAGTDTGGENIDTEF